MKKCVICVREKYVKIRVILFKKLKIRIRTRRGRANNRNKRTRARLVYMFKN